MVPPFESENRAIALTDASDSIVNWQTQYQLKFDCVN
jgi:hypothetical protein